MSNKTHLQYVPDFPVKDLKEYPDNPRILNASSMQLLKKSLVEHGLVDPLIVNSVASRYGFVIGGNSRLKAIKELGYETVQVILTPIEDLEQEKLLNLRLNRIHGDWDYDMLVSYELEFLEDAGFDISDFLQIYDYSLSIENDTFDAEKEAAQIKVPKTRPGQLIILGSHRLYCGDSTSLQSVSTLVGKYKVHTFNFDPIYNIDFDYKSGFGNKGKYGGSTKDKRSDKDYAQFLKTIFQNGLKFAHPDLHVFCWCDEKYIGLIQNLYSDLGIVNRRVCIWIKNNQNPTPQIAFNKAYEPCVYGTIGNPYLSPSVKNLNEVMNKEVSTGNRLPDDIMDLFNIWLEKRVNGQDYEHPTQKPPSLYEKALRRCTKPGDIVLDLFAGSGSLMIAAEQLKRRIFMCEIDPVFCDVIVARYERLTGKEAVYVDPK